MGLIEDIRDNAVDEGVSVGTVLRQCLILGHKVKYEPLRSWAQRELNGYAPEDDLPTYRLLHSHILCHIFIGGWKRENAMLPQVEEIAEFRDNVERLAFFDGVERLQELKDETKLARSLEPELVSLINHGMRGRGLVSTAWVPVPSGGIAGILGNVRSRVIDFVLRIEDEFPETDLGEIAIRPAAKQQVDRIFQTVVAGANAQIIVGGESIGAQQTNMAITSGNLESLKAFMRDQGVAEEDVIRLETLLEHDPQGKTLRQGDHGISEWVEEQSKRAVHGAGGVAREVAKESFKSVLTQAIFQYLPMATQGAQSLLS